MALKDHAILFVEAVDPFTVDRLIKNGIGRGIFYWIKCCVAGAISNNLYDK
jgi:hypothetical protein